MHQALKPCWLALGAATFSLAAGVASATCVPATAAAQALESQVEAEAIARDALMMARRSAQDWKNLLLRGGDPSQKPTFLTRFESNARDYADRLETLRSRLASLHAEGDRMQTLDRERGVMFGRYQSALAKHGVDSLTQAAAADRDSQGADVTTFRTLEQLIEALAARRAAGFRALQAEIERCAP